MNTKSYIAIICVTAVLIVLYGVLTLHPAGTGFVGNDQNSSTTSPSNPGYESHIDANAINAQWPTLMTYVSSPPLGNANAEYTIIEFGDFQCPQCGKIHNAIEGLVSNSGGKAKLYFINFPLRMHPHSRFAADASIAAADQGKFWQMYDVLYGHQDELIPSEVQYYAGNEIPSLNVDKYLADVYSAATEARVNAQIAETVALKVDSTPTLFVRKSSGGTPTWFVGIKDDNTAKTKGIGDLEKAPPWESGS